MKNLFFHFGRPAESQRPPAGATCHNCQAAVSTTYCGECGQKAAVHIASAREFLHHFIGHYIAAEGKLWRTLGWLIAKPGALTVAFIRGRRGQFIDPLRLLLTMSLLMFLVMRWQLYQLPHAAPAAAATSATTAAVSAPATAADAARVHHHDGVLFDTFARASDTFAVNYGKYAAQASSAQEEQFWEAWLRFGPTLLLCMVPLLALVLKVLHLGAGWRYGEHLVFSMHFQSVALLALIGGFGGMHRVTKLLIVSAVALYILLAMRKVYGGGWIVLLLRVAAFAFALAAIFEWLVRATFMARMM